MAEGDKKDSRHDIGSLPEARDDIIIYDVSTATGQRQQSGIEGVDAVCYLKITGPWKTKSEAELSVLCALPLKFLVRYLHYDGNQLNDIGTDIRGIRIYRVNNLSAGKSGGNEFHRIRKELLFALSGEVSVECKDLLGAAKTFKIDPYKGLYIPPLILHTYRTLTPADLLVVTNTLFIPDDPQTHDTFSHGEFDILSDKRKSEMQGGCRSV